MNLLPRGVGIFFKETQNSVIFSFRSSWYLGCRGQGLDALELKLIFLNIFKMVWPKCDVCERAEIQMIP